MTHSAPNAQEAPGARSRLRRGGASRLHFAAALLSAALCGAPGSAFADVTQGGAVVLTFARGGADQNHAVRIERDLRNMFDHGAAESGSKIPRVIAIEPRFDVGKLSKGDLEKSRRHFNDAQRALEQGDADEAMEQLFRAERFYVRGVPYIADDGLLRGIFFYYYLARSAAGLEDQARDAYCAYVALSRNLAGSSGPIEQFEPLADKCGETSIAGTGELKIASDVDGAHVYVDGRAVGVIGRGMPFVDPFIAAGPHIVEVRKAGFARWGTLLTLRNGKSESLRAQLKEAKNRKEDHDPLAELSFRGEDAFSDDYISDLFFQLAERFHASMLIAGYLEAAPGGAELTLFTFSNGTVERWSHAVSDGVDGHHEALIAFWKARFGAALNPSDALPLADRWAPTLFKVE